MDGGDSRQRKWLLQTTAGQTLMDGTGEQGIRDSGRTGESPAPGKSCLGLSWRSVLVTHVRHRGGIRAPVHRVSSTLPPRIPSLALEL